MEPFLDFVSTPGGSATALVVGLIVSYLLMMTKSHFESERKMLAGVAQKLAAMNFPPHIVALITDLSVRDLSGAVREGYEIHKILHDPAARVAAFEAAGKSILSDLLRDPDYRPRITQFIQDELDKHQPDQKSQFTQAVDSLFDQNSLLEDMKDNRARLKGLLEKSAPPAVASLIQGLSPALREGAVAASIAQQTLPAAAPKPAPPAA